MPSTTHHPLEPSVNRNLRVLVVLAGILLGFVVFAGAVEAKGKTPDELRERADELLDAGRHAKAAALYEDAWVATRGRCRDCVLGLFRAHLALENYAEAARAAGATLDLDAEDKFLVAEIETGLRNALVRTGGDDPWVLWGLIDALARRGANEEIVRLAEAHLTTPERRPLICAADVRVSLARPEPLPHGADLNARLDAAGWPGPFLGAGTLRPPKARHTVYRESAQGARMVGVVDRVGMLGEVRVVRPVPDKIPGRVDDSIRRSLFEPATHHGRRLPACYPFTVRLPTPVFGAPADEGPGPSDLYIAIQEMTSLDEVATLAERAGAAAPIDKRAAICAATVGQEELNRRLMAFDWPGPYFVTGDIADAEPRTTPPPEYPEAAKASGVEGEVTLLAVVGADGKVYHVETIEGLPDGVSEAAMKAVREWTFTPATRSGDGISVCREVRVAFPPG